MRPREVENGRMLEAYELSRDRKAAARDDRPVQGPPKPNKRSLLRDFEAEVERRRRLGLL